MRIALNCILLFFISVFCSGQGALNKFSIEIGAATTRNTLKVADFYMPFSKFNYHSINSPFINVSYRNKLSEKFDWELGLQLLEKGTKSEYGFTFPNGLSQFVSYRYLLSYAEMPIGIIFKRRLLSYSVDVVPSYLVDANFLYKENVRNLFSSSSVANTDYQYVVRPMPLFNRFDVGLNLAISRIINKKIDVELKFQKHFIRPYKPISAELNYQQTFFIGLRYYIGNRFVQLR